MAEIVLIRHGQASLGAANYDQLSDTGFSQAKILGEHWRQLNKPFDRIVMGSMLRHAQTTESFLAGYYNRDDIDLSNHPVTVHAGLNEYNHTYLLAELQRCFPEDWVDSQHLQRDYYHNIRQSLAYWADGKIPSDSADTWLSFEQRIQSALHASLQQPFKRLLLVTSGGPISNMLAQFLNMPPSGTIDLSLRIKNTSISTIVTNKVDFTVDTINDVSHLNTLHNQHLITLA